MVSILEFAWVMEADMKPLPKFRKQVSDKELKGECLLCGCKSRARGLCDHHLWKYRMALLQTPMERREEFKKQQILKGQLLPNRQGKRNDINRKKAKAS